MSCTLSLEEEAAGPVASLGEEVEVEEALVKKLSRVPLVGIGVEVVTFLEEEVVVVLRSVRGLKGAGE